MHFTVTFYLTMYRVFILVLLEGFVYGRESPQAGYLQKLKRSGNVNFPATSNDLLEDALLDVPGLVKKYKYPIEIHNVVTDDDYVLEMHRIPHDKEGSRGNKTVVFLMHGLLSSSADWLVLGPDKAIAYMLADAGYDVWMGNARGNYYSRKNLFLNPDDHINTAFWNFSWDEIGVKDLPKMIDYALHMTGKKKLHYIGHSQGTTSFFVMTSLFPDYNDKIISMHAYAPVAYMSHNRNPILQFIAPFSKDIAKLASLIGIGEFAPHSSLASLNTYAFCKGSALTQPLCTNSLFLIAGTSDQLNTTMLPVFLGHVPAGSSVKQLGHYGQGIAFGGFRRYDNGLVENEKRYKKPIPPAYDLSKITAPMYLWYSENDRFAEIPDVMRLYSELTNVSSKHRILTPGFAHLDYIWGKNARVCLYEQTLRIIKSLDAKT